MRKSLVMLACVFGVGAVVPTAPPAFAQSSLFEVIFGQQQRGKRYRQRQIERYRAQQAARPAPKIEAPSFYSYKPDAVKSVDLSPLAEIEVASADPFVVPPIPQGEFERSLRHLEGYRIQALKEVGDALIEYYEANHAFIWVTDMKPNARAAAAMEALSEADAFGLSSADYRLDLPADDYDSANMSERLRELIEFEVAMSAKALRYVLDATRGRIDPNRLSGYHDLKRKDVDLVSALGNLAATSDAKAYLEGSNPGNDRFEALTAELADLRAADAEDHIEIAEGTFLRPGRSSPELKNIVAAIRKRGSDALLVDHGITLMDYQAEGGELYTPELVALVRAFQTESDLKPDGIVGKMTIGKLSGMTNETKIDKVVLAMERLRWLPRDLGSRHVFINQPAYEASYIHDGKEGISMRAVVGKTSNQTSFFYDEIETVEYNPYWGVPRSIIVNEMLPKLRQDPSYLDRLGYELTDRSGRRVSSTNVDWYAVGSKVPVDVRQPPGRKNALGELKIMFPNKHAIYMHDTPAKNLFSRDARAFSHGCVRLQDPRGMAAAVLGTSRDHIASQIAQGRNMAEPVPGKIPVYVSYFTAWPEDDGTIGYYADMYGRDKHLDKAIKRTEQTRQAQG